MNSRFVPKIDKPCPANWEAMEGDEKRRFCEHCKLHVHNLSAMTEREQREVLSSKSGHKCVSYIAAPNAIPVTPQRWLNLQAITWSWRRSAALFAAFLSLLGVGCQSTPAPRDEPCTTGRVGSPTMTVEPDGKRTMGAPVLPPRPLWKRIFGLY